MIMILSLKTMRRVAVSVLRAMALLTSVVVI